ncbi:uncharacterized protein LOC129726517 [Wyeomyia smithii]|uniref:uncharacterized protein LOC129726517 n=1 Tax=Wyeomyia smithii TaxID=174621 RepID=UPI002467D2F2|nr:uncharacterized protein LOC129726517 [Wyeomyia smithii]
MSSVHQKQNTCVGSWLVIALLVSLGESASGLLCRQCFSLYGWDECEETARDIRCTTQGVTSSHLNLLHQNPSLAVGNHSEFSCFKYQARINRYNDRGLVTGYGRGCTFAVTDFCTGWKQAVAIKQCDVCSDRDLCNSGRLSVGSVYLLVIISLMIVGKHHSILDLNRK